MTMKSTPRNRPAQYEKPLKIEAPFKEALKKIVKITTKPEKKS